MSSLQLLTGPAAQAIGWALLHLIWQAAIVAGILAAVLALMSRQTANARYVVSCGALALVFALFVATAVRAYDPAAAPITPAPATGQTINVSLSELPVLIAQSAAAGMKQRALHALASARAALPTVVGIWLAGVILLSARLLVSWIRARRLVRRGAEPAAAELQLMAIRLADALGLRGAVKLLQSAAVEVPSVIGTLRPIVLIPASALTGMTPGQIEMVLAHELAHIRRHDFLVNLLQAVVETLMFYHPAVWWMSRRVRVERENCCDDMAVTVCGNPIEYARALTRLEELRANALPVVVAANGGSLLERIRRIAAGRAEGTTSSSRWAAAVAMLAVLVIAIAVPTLPALAQREKKKSEQKAETPQAAAAKIDVIERAAQVRAYHQDRDDDIDVDADVDVDLDIDADVDEDIDEDSGRDFDFEIGEAPEPPEPPEIAMHVGVPAPAPAPAPGRFAVPALAPAPLAHLAMLDRDRDRDRDREDDTPIDGNRQLTVDELIELRAVGVTPEYLNTMRQLFPDLTLKGVTGMRAVGVTTEYIRQMRAAGFEITSARDATSLRAVGVTPEFVQRMRDAGLDVRSTKDATSLAAVGVSPDWLRGIRDAGIEVTSARQATSMRAVGVTPEFIRAMRDAGFAVTDPKDATSLAAVGVTAGWVREMKAAGVDLRSAKDAQDMRAVGVTPDFVRRLAKAGYTNLTPRELTRMAANGVDDDFIREMEQYRKKN